MSAEGVTVLEAFNDALAKGEPRLDLIDPEIVVVDHDIPDAGTYEGHEGFLKWVVEDWGSAWDSWEFHEGEVLDAGDTVVSVFELTARGKGSGIETRRRNATVNTVRDGRIVRLEYYTTEDEARSAAGLTASRTE